MKGSWNMKKVINLLPIGAICPEKMAQELVRLNLGEIDDMENTNE